MYAVCAHRHLDTHATGKSACCTVMAWLWSSDTDRVNKRKTVLMNSLFLVRLHVQLCLLYTPDEVLRWGGVVPSRAGVLYCYYYSPHRNLQFIYKPRYCIFKLGGKKMDGRGKCVSVCEAIKGEKVKITVRYCLSKGLLAGNCVPVHLSAASTNKSVSA